MNAPNVAQLQRQLQQIAVVPQAGLKPASDYVPKIRNKNLFEKQCACVCVRVRAVFTVQVISPTETVSAASFSTLIGSLEVASPLFHSVFGHIIPQAPPLTSAGGGNKPPPNLSTSPTACCSNMREVPAEQARKRSQVAVELQWPGVISLIPEMKIIELLIKRNTKR